MQRRPIFVLNSKLRKRLSNGEVIFTLLQRASSIIKVIPAAMSELQGHGKDAFLNNAADYWSSASESVSTVDSTCDYGAGDSGYLGQFSEGEDTTVGGEVRLTRQASDLSSEGEETDDNEINDNVGEDDAPSSSFNE